MKEIPYGKHSHDAGIKQKSISFDVIQTNIFRPDRKHTCLREEEKKKIFISILSLTYGVTFVAFWDLGVVVGLRGGV